MRKLILATAGVAVVAFVAATLGSAQPTATTGATASQAKAPVLPKLPADIAARKRFIIGVKCDTPPFGYLDVRGKNAGVDVEIAQQFARYAFGRAQRLTFVCAPTAVREPLLTYLPSRCQSRQNITPPHHPARGCPPGKANPQRPGSPAGLWVRSWASAPTMSFPFPLA